MKKKIAVHVSCDVYMDWQGPPPRYRVWVNDQLFLEQTFTWQHCYLEHQLCIIAPASKTPGQVAAYSISHELLDPAQAQLRAVNFRVLGGPATIDQQGTVTVAVG